MQHSGLDPDGGHTVLLMDFDDLTDVVAEAAKVQTDVFEHRKLNLRYFTGLLVMRLLEPGMDQIRTMDFMTSLQRKRPWEGLTIAPTNLCGSSHAGAAGFLRNVTEPPGVPVRRGRRVHHRDKLGPFS